VQLPQAGQLLLFWCSLINPRSSGFSVAGYAVAREKKIQLRPQAIGFLPKL
jgi:hypothetical protein